MSNNKFEWGNSCYMQNLLKDKFLSKEKAYCNKYKNQNDMTLNQIMKF